MLKLPIQNGSTDSCSKVSIVDKGKSTDSCSKVSIVDKGKTVFHNSISIPSYPTRNC